MIRLKACGTVTEEGGTRSSVLNPLCTIFGRPQAGQGRRTSLCHLGEVGRILKACVTHTHTHTPPPPPLPPPPPHHTTQTPRELLPQLVSVDLRKTKILRQRLNLFGKIRLNRFTAAVRPM